MNPEQIVKKKETLAQQLNELRRAYLIAIYKALFNNEHIQDIHKEILKTTLNFKKIHDKKINLEKMNLTAIQVASKLYNSSFAGILLFGLIDKLYHTFAKPILQTTNEYEHLLKTDYLKDTIGAARKEGKVFYLCSKHLDSAKDHEPYQGKIYVDNQFDLYSNGGEVYKLIKNNEYDTIQNITGAPVYMVTRPNCRHYFKAISLQELQTETTDSLLKKYGMLRKVGNSPWINPRLKMMEEKLKFYKQLYLINDAPYIKNSIKKYKNYLQEHK